MQYLSINMYKIYSFYREKKKKNSKDYFRQMILAKHSIGNNFV